MALSPRLACHAGIDYPYYRIYLCPISSKPLIRVDKMHSIIEAAYKYHLHSGYLISYLCLCITILQSYGKKTNLGYKDFKYKKYIYYIQADLNLME